MPGDGRKTSSGTIYRTSEISIYRNLKFAIRYTSTLCIRQLHILLDISIGEIPDNVSNARHVILISCSISGYIDISKAPIRYPTLHKPLRSPARFIDTSLYRQVGYMVQNSISQWIQTSKNPIRCPTLDISIHRYIKHSDKTSHTRYIDISVYRKIGYDIRHH